MSFKSEAQKRKFEQMVKDGTMAQSTYDEWAANTTGKLPERVEQKPKRRTGPHLAWAEKPKKASKA